MGRPRVLFVDAEPRGAGGDQTASMRLFLRLRDDGWAVREWRVDESPLPRRRSSLRDATRDRTDGTPVAGLGRLIEAFGPDVAVGFDCETVLLIKAVAPALTTIFLADRDWQVNDQRERQAVLACDLLVATSAEALASFERRFPTAIGRIYGHVVSTAPCIADLAPADPRPSSMPTEAYAHITSLLEAVGAPDTVEACKRSHAEASQAHAGRRRVAPRWPTPRLRLGLLSRVLQRVSFERLRSPSSRETAARKVGFVVWRYPMLSQTFIRGEVRALRDAGVALEVIAAGRDQPPVTDDSATVAGGVTYLGDFQKRRGRAFVMRAACRRPWTVLRLWLLLVRHQHPHATWWSVRDALYAAGHMASVLHRHAVTHVHAAWADAFAMHAFVASAMLGLPFSVQARASEIHRFVHRSALLDRIRFARLIVTNSLYNQRHLRERLESSSGGPPVHVIYNGVDLDRFAPARRTHRADGTFRLLSVGRMVEPKGFRYLVEAVALLRDRGIDVRCDIIGAPEEVATWVEMRIAWAQLNLHEQVHFLGSRSTTDVIAALADTDLFVLPCVRGRDGSHDITPNVVLEAMAMGLPVVSTTSGAIPELVTHGVDGWLVPPGDATSLADGIAHVLRDPALAARLGSAARQTVERRFDLRRNTRQRAALFQAVTDGGVAPSADGPG